MAQPIATLTTDFGLADHYVGSMKGVILGICPRAQIVDISHEVAAFRIAEGAYLIAQAYGCFPAGTVHVVVVDPGVGTARRPVLVEAGGQYFVGPDNGVFSIVYAREAHRVRSIENERYFRHPVSRTFHGRDIFAPAAAHLLAGVPPARFGKVVGEYVRGEFASPRQAARGAWEGSILRVDRFGNIVTNFRASDFPGLESGRFTLTLGRHRVSTLAGNYAESAPGKLFAIVGSGGFLEVSLARDSAARIAGSGGRVALRLRA